MKIMKSHSFNMLGATDTSQTTKTLQEELLEQMWHADERNIHVQDPRDKENTNDTELKMKTEFWCSKSMQSLEKMNCNVSHFRQSEINSHK